MIAFIVGWIGVCLILSSSEPTAVRVAGAALIVAALAAAVWLEKGEQD